MIVVVAGTDGALPAVVAGLVEAPVIAVPTSVGYGAALQVRRQSWPQQLKDWGWLDEGASACTADLYKSSISSTWMHSIWYCRYACNHRADRRTCSSSYTYQPWPSAYALPGRHMLLGIRAPGTEQAVTFSRHTQGITPLLAALTASSPGVSVVNIDNGFGAGMLAARILKTAAKLRAQAMSAAAATAAVS